MFKSKTKTTRDAILAIAKRMPPGKFFTFFDIKEKMVDKGMSINSYVNPLMRQVLEENNFRRVNRQKWLPPKKAKNAKTKFTRTSSGSRTPRKKLTRSSKTEISMAEIGESVYAFINKLKSSITKLEDKLQQEKDFRKEVVKAHKTTIREQKSKIEDLKRDKRYLENSSSGVSTTKLEDVATIRTFTKNENGREGANA